jgi:hypothetical protein
MSICFRLFAAGGTIAAFDFTEYRRSAGSSQIKLLQLATLWK